jgi:hypothetical protein
MVEICLPCRLADIKKIIKRGDRLTAWPRNRPGEDLLEIRVERVDDQSGAEGGQLNVMGCPPDKCGVGRPWLTLGEGTKIVFYEPRRSRP